MKTSDLNARIFPLVIARRIRVFVDEVRPADDVTVAVWQLYSTDLECG